MYKGIAHLWSIWTLCTYHVTKHR